VITDNDGTVIFSKKGVDVPEGARTIDGLFFINLNNVSSEEVLYT
jgi:hypothetical protein